MEFGRDPRRVPWMAIPCPRAATGDGCPASPQGAPLTPTALPRHTNTHTLFCPTETCRWMSSTDNCIHDPKIATERLLAGCKTQGVKADHDKMSDGKHSTNVKQFDTNTHTHSWGYVHMVSISKVQDVP